MFKTVLVLSVALAAIKIARTTEGTLGERLAYVGRGLLGGHRKSTYTRKH